MECSQAQLVDSWQVECSRPSPGQGRQHLPLNWNLAMNLDSKLLLSPLHTCEHSTFWSNESCNNFLIDFCQLVSNYQILSSFWGGQTVGWLSTQKRKLIWIVFVIFLIWFSYLSLAVDKWSSEHKAAPRIKMAVLCYLSIFRCCSMLVLQYYSIFVFVLFLRQEVNSFQIYFHWMEFNAQFQQIVLNN